LAKILVVDDSAFQRHVIRRLVSRLGHDVVEAENGEIGLRVAAESVDIAAIVLDLLMPVLDGFGMLEGLQSAGCTIPRIVVTADVQAKSRERCLELGALAVIEKPFGEEALRDILSSLASLGAAAPWR
jgi:twitching motility two-component system response regulator PilH